VHWLLFVTPAITLRILLSIYSVCEVFFLFFSEVTASSGVKIYRLVFVRDIVSYAKQCVSENCLSYMEHRVVIHTEYTEKWGAISQNCVGWYFALQFLATRFGPFKNPPSSNLKYTKRDHLIHQINIFIFRAVGCHLFYYGCLGPETKYKQEIK